MKEINGRTQMRDLWSLPAVAKWEKSCGKHPTQKPLTLLARIILASSLGFFNFSLHSGKAKPLWKFYKKMCIVILRKRKLQNNSFRS